MPYRVDRHNHQLVYLEHPDREHFTPPPEAELIAVFMDAGNETADLHALHYTRAMNATMPGCTCRVVCCCGALVGTTPGCETCAEHNGECAAQPDEKDLIAQAEASRLLDLVQLWADQRVMLEVRRPHMARASGERWDASNAALLDRIAAALEQVKVARERLAFAGSNARSARRRLAGESKHNPLPPLDGALEEIERARAALSGFTAPGTSVEEPTPAADS